MPLEKNLTLLYVDNDAAMRGLVGNVLKTSSAVADVIDFSTSAEAISFAKRTTVDAALLEYDFGTGNPEVIATATELRCINSKIGIVFFSRNHRGSTFDPPKSYPLKSFSFVENMAEIKTNDLLRILIDSAQGLSNLNRFDYRGSLVNLDDIGTKLLTLRQDVIMSLLALGYEQKFIAQRLGVSGAIVRQELSVAYGVLVPNPRPGSDLRVSAILKYQKYIGNLGLSEH
jgi:DNA-binding NarL/FixJ family response regulator